MDILLPPLVDGARWWPIAHQRFVRGRFTQRSLLPFDAETLVRNPRNWVASHRIACTLAFLEAIQDDGPMYKGHINTKVSLTTPYTPKSSDLYIYGSIIRWKSRNTNFSKVPEDTPVRTFMVVLQETHHLWGDEVCYELHFSRNIRRALAMTNSWGRSCLGSLHTAAENEIARFIDEFKLFCFAIRLTQFHLWECLSLPPGSQPLLTTTKGFRLLLVRDDISNSVESLSYGYKLIFPFSSDLISWKCSATVLVAVP